MNWLLFFQWLNNDILALPATVAFLGVALFLTFKTRFLQLRGFGRFMHLLASGVRGKGKFDGQGTKRTINPFHALFASMSTTIGMGSVVGPSVAIIAGGPGALFWLLLYIFFGSATKFAEVTFALSTRTQTPDGRVVGGPMQYLKAVSVVLAAWYGVVMVFLFAGWSGLQSNTLATIYAQQGVPLWATGLALAVLAWVVLQGGAQRVGLVASKLVPFMFCLYIFFSGWVLFANFAAFTDAIKLVVSSIFTTSSAVGGCLAATVFQAMRAGMYSGVFITESGLGTSSIAHAVADTKRPTDQGLLAMYSGIADLLLSFVSGMLVLVTGVCSYGEFRSTLVFEAFGLYAPTIGQIVLLVSISLFILTTIIGNSFNGTQSFASLTANRGTRIYQLVTCTIIFFGALMPVSLVWQMMDTILVLVAMPNLLGLVVLSILKPDLLEC
jgi:alanine or glycine:cation symporter, AGCS family